MTTGMPRQKAPIPPELRTFPDKLRLARKERGLSLPQLSELTGIDTSQLSRYERGERLRGMQLATVIRLSRALGLPTGYLAGDPQEGPVPVFREPEPKRRRKPDGE